MCIKASLEDESTFSDVLNFNYKFKDIYSKTSELNGYDKIRLQTDSFSNVETFRELIQNIVGNNDEIKKLNINTERFLTYSYLCIDQSAWDNVNGFEKIENQFIKYANVLSADNSVSYDENSVETLSKWKYAKIGLTRSSVSLFASNYDMNNYTILPYEYENQYFYTYILNLYKKLYLEKMANKYKETKDIKKIRKEFTEFTKELWIRETTEDIIGIELNNRIEDILGLEKLYREIKNKYDILYKDLNIRKSVKANFIVLVILMLSLMLNIYNFIILSN